MCVHLTPYVDITSTEHEYGYMTLKQYSYSTALAYQ